MGLNPILIVTHLLELDLPPPLLFLRSESFSFSLLFPANGAIPARI